MRPASPVSRAGRRAFTLVELLVTVAIFGLVSLAIIRFTLFCLNIYYYDTGRLLVNKDIRTFTQRMSTDAIYANYFRIYPDFATRSVTTGGVTTDARVHDGQSGDFLVLVFADTDTASGITTINRLIGYYRDPADPKNPASTGPIRKFDITLKPAVNATTPLYSLLNTCVPVSTAHTHPTVIQLAQGLSNGTLFYDFYDRSIMVRCQVIEAGNQFRRAVNTYNFTVSPRG